MPLEFRPPGEVHAPHPPLPEYYPNEAARRDWVRSIFDRTAPDYARVERVMAFGTGPRYRRLALVRAGLTQGMRVVDVGTGTGLVAREAARILGDASAVTAIDPSAGMLRHAKLPGGAGLLGGDAEHLPLRDACADLLTMGYALRHISDLSAAFKEFFRVLKPGGIVCILEVTRPDGRIGAALLKAYLRGVVPVLARVISRTRDTPRLMRYYWDTIDACVPPEQVMGALSHAGFGDVARHVELGLFSEYRARKPA
ncbi:MAG: class I SAM-dependent methyltransferase [Betaproteobacteria bacterium]|jgi:demethylmenaquinone methyltransferase/2-methoxy-6-polyprenyl-1,4-benzoquinol methylase|nr:class I SAM-dependent methyltransferase [Betaproteobacteria bacterium]